MAIIVSDWAEFIAAAGTAGAEVEFPKNLVKTADTAVDPSKLYVDANGKIKTNVQPTDLANLYENTFVLDANDYAPDGVTSTIAINCAGINGYGGKIINLASSKVYIFNIDAAASISGIAFLNINCETVGLYSSTYFVTFNYCMFSGRGINTGLFFSNNASRACYPTFNNCSLNLEFIGNCSFSGYYYYSWTYTVYYAILNTCKLMITHEDKDTISASGEFYIRPINSYIEGAIASGVRVGFSYASDSILDFECIASSLTVSDNGSTMIFANTDKWKRNLPSSFIGVTTEQLTDAEYLSGKGFPIQT